jgi:hypothetical protein
MRAVTICLLMLSSTFMLFGASPAWAASSADAEPYDIVIVNGHIIDGTGSPWYSGDVGIRGGGGGGGGPI